LTIKTQPWGEVKGRLIGEHAKWLRNQVIESVPKDLKADNAGILTDFFTTNEEGEFHIVGLVPGKEYRLVPTNYPFVGAPEVIVVAKSGEVVDAGDVVAVSAIRRAREQPGDNH